MAEVIRRNALMSGDLRPRALAVLNRVQHHPPRPLAQAYFELNHNETFGNGIFVKRNARVTGSGWPEAMLVVNGLGWLNGPYGITRAFLKRILSFWSPK